MKVNYTGKLDKLDPASQKKLDARYQKLGKLLDRKAEKEAHVILNTERHLRQAEITVNYYDHALVGKFAAREVLEALLGACDRLEKQILKRQTKFRDNKRKSTKELAVEEPAPAAVDNEPAGPRIYRANGKKAPKPMTVDEAVLEIDAKKNYLVYRDAETDRVSVLLRRPDGHFDLIES